MTGQPTDPGIVDFGVGHPPPLGKVHVQPSPDRATSVAGRFDWRSNGITPLRLILALIVLAMHAWPAGGFGPDPVQRLTDGRVDGGGTLAVLCFFGLSGFLLADSRTRTGTTSFLLRRAARILPGYWVCIAASALIVGPWYLSMAWFPSLGVGGVTWAGFALNPLPQVNAPLWTLGFEIVCYICVAVTPPRHMGRLIVSGSALALWLMAAGAPGSGAALVVAFFAGVAMSRYGSYIPLNGRLAAIGLVAAFATAGPGLSLLVTSVVLPYVVVWVASKSWPRLGFDLSYGVYIYAFPITQLLMIAGVGALGPLGLAAATVMATIPVAAASWFMVEGPALRLQRGSSRRQREIPRRRDPDLESGSIWPRIAGADAPRISDPIEAPTR